MIDVEAESRALAERSRALAEQLENAIPAVDKAPVATALAESRRLGLEAKHARDHVARRVAAGAEPGVPLGPQPPIRRVPSTPSGRDPDPVLRGRAVVTPELIAYWQHRRDVLGPAIVGAHEQAAEGLGGLRPLLAACRGQIAALRPRGEDDIEGGPELRAALQHFTDLRGALAAGIADGQHESQLAADRLQILRGEATAGSLASAGVDAVTPWLMGRVASALNLDVIDPAQPLGPQAKEPAPHPATRAHPVATRSTASWRAGVEPIVRSSLPSAAEPVQERFFPDAGVRVKGSSRLELR